MENICSRRLSNSDEKNCFQVDQKKLIKYRLNDIDQMELKNTLVKINLKDVVYLE